MSNMASSLSSSFDSEEEEIDMLSKRVKHILKKQAADYKKKTCDFIKCPYCKRHFTFHRGTFCTSLPKCDCCVQTEEYIQPCNPSYMPNLSSDEKMSVFEANVSSYAKHSLEDIQEKHSEVKVLKHKIEENLIIEDGSKSFEAHLKIRPLYIGETKSQVKGQFDKGFVASQTYDKMAKSEMEFEHEKQFMIQKLSSEKKKGISFYIEDGKPLGILNPDVVERLMKGRKVDMSKKKFKKTKREVMKNLYYEKSKMFSKNLKKLVLTGKVSFKLNDHILSNL